MSQEPIRFHLLCHRHTVAELEDLASVLPKSARLILCYTKSMPTEYSEFANRIDCGGSLDVSKFDREPYIIDDPELLRSSFQAIFTDPSTTLIWERSTTSVLKNIGNRILGRLPSFTKGSAWIAEQVVISIRALKALQPSFLLFSSTPHTIGVWVRMKVAQQMDIPVLVIDRCAVDGFYRISDQRNQTDRDIEIGPLNEENRKVHADRLNEMICKIHQSYLEAQPEYERLRFAQNRGKYISQINLWKQNWYAPTRAINAILCWRRLSALSKKYSHVQENKYAVFFLHYQPERTTAPDGGLFGPQLNAVLILRSALPDDVTLLVKEHPSTFTFRCDPLAREPDFYSRIASDPNIELVDIGTDNFDLIDSAVVTATITGTVARESLIRGTPAIFFGKAFLGDSEGCFKYRKNSDLQEFIRRIISGELDRKLVQERAIDAMVAERDNAFYSAGPNNDSTKIDALKRLFSSPYIKQETWK